MFISFVYVSASQAQKDYGLKETASEGYGAKIPFSDKGQGLSSIIGQIVGVGLSFIGVIFFVLVIYGGFLWMTAMGNEEQVGKAISLVMQASIGLIIVASAYLITRFVSETILNK